MGNDRTSQLKESEGRQFAGFLQRKYGGSLTSALTVNEFQNSIDFTLAGVDVVQVPVNPMEIIPVFDEFWRPKGYHFHDFYSLEDEVRMKKKTTRIDDWKGSCGYCYFDGKGFPGKDGKHFNFGVDNRRREIKLGFSRSEAFGELC